MAGRGGPAVRGSGNGGGRRRWWGGFAIAGEAWRRQQSCPAGLDEDLKDIYPGWAEDSPRLFGACSEPGTGRPNRTRAQSAGTRSAAPAARALNLGEPGRATTWCAPVRAAAEVPAPTRLLSHLACRQEKDGVRAGFFFLSSRSRGPRTV